jgi:hypothetical protein
MDIGRMTHITVCLRPFRAEGPRLDVETIGAKRVVHNYGHGGSGWSLSWGSAALAARNASCNPKTSPMVRAILPSSAAAPSASPPPSPCNAPARG